MSLRSIAIGSPYCTVILSMAVYTVEFTPSLAGLYHARSCAQRDDDPVRRLGLQLVELVHAPVDSQQTCQSDYFPPAPAARHRAQDQSQQSIYVDADQLARRS